MIGTFEDNKVKFSNQVKGIEIDYEKYNSLSTTVARPSDIDFWLWNESLVWYSNNLLLRPTRRKKLRSEADFWQKFVLHAQPVWLFDIYRDDN